MKTKRFPEYEYHKALMTAREQLDPEWAKTYRYLLKKARAGDDETFFQLLERNPEFLKTKSAIAKIIEWRYAIEYLRPFDRAKETFRTSRQELDARQERIDRAKENLLRIGKVLAFEEGKDLRGKKKSPYLFDIYYLHRGLLSLFRGIKKLWKIDGKTKTREGYEYLFNFLEESLAKNPDRFLPISEVINALKHSRYGWNEETLWFIIKDTPSGFALVATAEIFGLSQTTVKAALKKFKKEGRPEMFKYLQYSSSVLKEKGQKIYFDFLVPMIAFENLRGIDVNKNGAGK